MKYYVLSDIHIDFWENRGVGGVVDYEGVYNKFFVDAENLIIAGDISNDVKNYIKFIEFIQHKYKNIYIVLGNHDIVVNTGFTIDSHVFNTSEEKIKRIKDFCSSIPNVHLLDGEVIDGVGGTMSFVDFRYIVANESVETIKLKWRLGWFDSKAWNYMNNDPDLIFNHYDKMIVDILKKKPKIIVTHYFPLQMGVAEKYKHFYSTAFFTFDAEKYLESIEEDAIWVCGHTHISSQNEYINKKGVKIKFLCNPMAYPFENALGDGGYKKEDFLIEV